MTEAKLEEATATKTEAAAAAPEAPAPEPTPTPTPAQAPAPTTITRKPVSQAASQPPSETDSGPTSKDANGHTITTASTNEAEKTPLEASSVATTVAPTEKTDEPQSTQPSTQTQPTPTPETKKWRRISRKPVPSPITNVDKSKPEDFEGEVLTNNELPSVETLKKIEDYIVLDRDGKSHTFKSLYSGTNVARRVLVIFIRHFFCGNCQDYIRSLSESISPESLLGLPLSTFVTIIGCGDPAFIEGYAKDTNCPFPIYTDPRRSLFDALGMNQTLAMGSKPAYMKRPMSQSVFASIAQGLKAIPQGLALKGGNQRQVGGEFLFEPAEMVTPMSSPKDAQFKVNKDTENRDGAAKEAEKKRTNGDTEPATVEEKTVTWCHRMKTTRDHCEIPELRDILGLNGQGAKDQEKWAQALLDRKGTGSSMARQMSELSAEPKLGAI